MDHGICCVPSALTPRSRNGGARQLGMCEKGSLLIGNWENLFHLEYSEIFGNGENILFCLAGDLG